MPAQARACAQGEADDGADQQDRHARRPRAEPVAAHRDPAHRVDSAGRAARPARAARTRMVLVRQRTRHKNRIHATLAKYALRCDEVSDLFGVRGRALLRRHLEALPPHTAFATRLLLEQVEHLDRQVRALEDRMRSVFEPTPMVQWLMTLPGVGFILAVVIALELGDIRRFPDAERFAGYAGTTPRVHASAGKTRHGPLRPDVNRYLKGAFMEAADVTNMQRRHDPRRHVTRLYARLARRKGHSKAIGAVARHLAEATYWMVTRQEG